MSGTPRPPRPFRLTAPKPREAELHMVCICGHEWRRRVPLPYRPTRRACPKCGLEPRRTELVITGDGS